MKTKLLLLLTGLLATISTYAYTNLRVQDPQATWRNYQGNIDTAVLSIKPKGAYFEYGLYLTFSSKPQTNSSDTFEVQMYFDLPEGAIVTDSWLWVGNQIVQASIMDRGRANIIYEGIVQRRQDPSILYKNSDTQYELRVFPQPANQTRKVKITYLVPANWGVNKVSAELPLNILKASKNIPYFEVISYADPAMAPAIAEMPSVNLTGNAGPNNSYRAQIPASYYNSTGALSYSISSPMQNGVFAAKYETGPNDGYYQLVLLPSQALNITSTKKAALMFDYEPGLSTTTPNEVLNSAKQMLLEYYTPTDSFNLFFSNYLNIYSPSNVWLPCDTATINYTFSHLQGGNPVSTITNIPGLLGSAISFIKQNGADGELVMITNSDNYANTTSANSMISAVQVQMSPYLFPLHTISYANQNYSTHYANNKSYQANEYLFSNLAVLTGGNYKEVVYSTSYYNNYYYPFSTTIDELFAGMEGSIYSFDLYPDVANGFCYGKYSSAASQVAALNKPVIQVGKYHGTLPLTVEVSGVYQNTLFSEQLNINSYFDADSATRKMWVGSYIHAMEHTTLDNMTIMGLVDSSIHNRVLSRYTAFLALEPSDTVTACNDCEDETNPGGPSVGIDDVETDSLTITAMPNPFSDAVTLKVHLSAGSKQANLKIYNLMGQVVKTYTPEADTNRDFTFEWNGTDEGGETVAAGMYIAILETDTARQTLKLMKR